MRVLITCLFLAAATPAMADDSANPRCAAKAETIKTQLRTAEAAGQSGRVKGLNTALEQVRANCTDQGLQRELEGKVAAARDEVREREADLREAELGGDAAKIDKRQSKLNEARHELQQAEAELNP